MDTQTHVNKSFTPLPEGERRAAERRRFKAEAVALANITAAIGLGYLGYHTTRELPESIGLIGMMVCALTAACMIERANNIRRRAQGR